MQKFSLYFAYLLLLYVALILQSCQEQKDDGDKIRVIFDTDANNELDDQHALAYLLFNGDTFQVEGVTVNATFNGGDIEAHYQEAERVIQLSDLQGKVPLLKGANAGFDQIKEQVNTPNFDGAEAVDFIIEKAKEDTSNKLVLLAVGKLTNVALALEKDPSIAPHVRVVWLGSNYPEPGEYNQDNDTLALNYILNSDVAFEMVTVRYGKPSGTDAVRVTQEEVKRHMPGKGPKVATPVTGRHEVAFDNFGDYSVNLFEHIQYHGNPPARALFDMAAVAIVKDSTWASAKQIPAPILRNNKWVERPENTRTITVWENFDKEKIMADFYRSMEHYVLVE
jgi:hypothetical protein